MFRLALVVAMSVAGSAAAQTHTVKLNGHTFTLPKDFTIELAAGADLAPRPIACDFDEKGRLYVTDSSGSNEKVAVQVEKKPHRIVRLEDTNGDGKFDKQTVFVKNVMFPEGCMWLNGSLYVAAPPHIWKFTDTNDDGVADKEEIWFDGKTLTGCANDLHGPYRGPDGWIYWCKGAFAQQEYTVNGKKFTTKASHIFRAMPDGTKLEPVMTGGMDNPVDLVFTPGGDIIFSCTFFQHPRDGKRDGLIHAVYGAVYGKDHDPVYHHPWTQPTLMPPLTHMGPAAPCGLHRLESDQFGKDYANNVFCCQFNLRKVSRHVLVPKGSTYETKDSDFVVSDNLDFHPTDVIEDADGSLLIVDTGGWYKLCCPTSQLVKPDVTGAIYRVRKTGAHKVNDPRGLKIEWGKANSDVLEELLRDPRPAVHRYATDLLVHRPPVKNIPDSSKAVFIRAFFSNSTEDLQLRALRGVSRLPDPDLKLMLRMMNRGGDSVRIAAIHVFGTHRYRPAVDELCDRLEDGLPPVRRALAEALGRIGDPAAIPSILFVLADERTDRTLDHALTYALIEIGETKRLAERIAEDKSPRVRRACLAALENMPDGGLKATTVLKDLDAKDADLRETAWWIAGRHPQWGDQLAGYFKGKLANADKLKPEERDELADRLRKFVGTPAIRLLLAEAVKDPKTVALACGVMARSGLKAMPKEWAEALTKALTANPRTLDHVLPVFRVLPATKDEYENLVKVSLDALVKMDLVAGAQLLPVYAAAPPGVMELDSRAFDLVSSAFRKELSADAQALSADILARHKLRSEQFIDLSARLNKVSPLDLPRLLNVFEKSKDEKVGLALVKALREPAVQASIRAEMVKPILDKYPKAVQDEASKLYEELAEARKGETAKLDKLLADLKPGDVRRGQLVFNSTKAQCIACHKVGYVGGLVGPDLTKIGGIRTERDLLESIVFPNASFVRSYEPVRVLTTDERTFNGILKKDAADEIIVVVAADKEERIARADIASITPSSISLMPAGLDQQLTPQEIADLVAFLRACK